MLKLIDRLPLFARGIRLAGRHVLGQRGAVTVCVVVCGLIAGLVGGAEPDPRDVEFFERRIRPVLVEHCYECHQGDTAEGGLSLESRDGLRRGGMSGPAIRIGQPDQSLLIRSLRHDDARKRMPKDAPRLPDTVIADLAAWIRRGAVDPRDQPDRRGAENASWERTLAERRRWWSFQPVRRTPPPTASDGRTSDSASAAHPVDRFLDERLRENRLEPAPLADPSVLLRRITMVLTGLPPDPDEVEEFVRAAERDREAAVLEVVERNLASPHFGERWGRHWLDLVRYCDTHGSEHDALLPHAWRYRDYVIRAWNGDLSYDQFVREHLAGDLIEPRWNRQLGLNEALLGTAWWRFIEFYQTPVDVKNEEVVVIDSQLDAFGKTFLGLTIACARCHDHKFDPISQRDFTALYGIFASTRTTMRRPDDPAPREAIRTEIERVKQQIRLRVAERWQRNVAELSSERWMEVVSKLRGERPTGPKPLESGARVFVDFADGRTHGWYTDGGFQRPAAAGAFALHVQGDSLVAGLYPSGRYSHLISEKEGGALRSPNFTLDMRSISVLVTGVDSRLRLVIENFEGNDLLFAPVTPRLNSRGRWSWVTLPIRDNWRGRRAYLELLPRDDVTYVGVVKDALKLPQDGRSSAGVRRVVFHDGPPPTGPEFPLPDAVHATELTATEAVRSLRQLSSEAIAAWAAEQMRDAQADWLQTLVAHGVLDNTIQEDVAELVRRYRELDATFPIPSRFVGVTDEDIFDERFFPRGNHRRPGAVVPRRSLEVLHGSKPFDTTGSGRRELADQLTSADHPLFDRVIVNRLWHYVFGRGLVASVDNFGQLGQTPSHPELLDWLADEFRTHNRSPKHLLRLLLTSRAFGRSSRATPQQMASDPDNRWLARASVRRLDAEAIRDALLVAGERLDRRLYGPGIPVALPDTIVDHQKPVSGPRDGAGRRTIYLEARRNFPSTFLTAFDWPRPIATTGARTTTNVPAQSLTLENDPFVIEMAARAGAQARRAGGDARQGIVALYRAVLRRPPNDDELRGALEFVADSGRDKSASGTVDDAWRDLAHALLQTKEFIYLP